MKGGIDLEGLEGVPPEADLLLAYGVGPPLTSSAGLSSSSSSSNSNSTSSPSSSAPGRGQAVPFSLTGHNIRHVNGLVGPDIADGEDDETIAAIAELVREDQAREAAAARAAQGLSPDEDASPSPASTRYSFEDNASGRKQMSGTKSRNVEFSGETFVDEVVDIGGIDGIDGIDGTDGNLNDEDDCDDSSKVDSRKAVRRARNAEACRRTRRKRKAHEENLRLRNAELEASREHFLKRIADLQFQVNSLRMTGTIDLRKENELLRAEIRKHKVYISNVIDAVQKEPQVKLEERARLLKRVVDGAICQCIGMAHTSINWREMYSLRLDDGMEVRFLFETLPKDVPLAEAKRITLRCEAYAIPAEPQGLNAILSNLWADEKRKERFSQIITPPEGILRRFLTFVCPELDQAKEFLGDERLGVYTFEEAKAGDSPTRVVMSCCTATRDLVPDAILTLGKERNSSGADSSFGELTASAAAAAASGAKGNAGVVPCCVFAATTCGDELKRAHIEVGPDASLDAKIFNGHVVVPSSDDPNQCHLVLILSTPIGDFPGLTALGHIVDEDGLASENFKQYFAAHLNFFLDELVEAANKNAP